MDLIIVDYGMGNLGSISNMLKKIGHQCVITSSKELIKSASKLILPGVGSFDRAMDNLDKLDLINVLTNKVQVEKTPVLGICLGMQLLGLRSEEGLNPGLGWIDGEVIKFVFNKEWNQQLKIPHMGWNEVITMKENALLMNLVSPARFYFVHSYYFVCHRDEDVLLNANYGHNFVAGLAAENIMGVQFHPEKSHRFGMQLLKNFVEKF